jgi:phosphoglycerate kinase
MARIHSVRELPVEGRKVFLRLDFNVPVKDGAIRDETRITEALPTLRHLLDRGAAVVACSHLGRPKGKVLPEFSLAPVAARLRELVPGSEVLLAADACGEDARTKAEALKPGQVLLLENIRFEPGETKDDPALAAALRALADIFVNDAFGALHRAHASVHALALLFPERAMGLLVEKELLYLREKLADPPRPYTAILGGAKVSDKIPVLTTLTEKVDALCIGGAMAYTFLRAKGVGTGSSLVEPDQVEAAAGILRRASERGIPLLLPEDHVAAPSMESPKEAKIVGNPIPDGLMGLDIGPRTLAAFVQQVAASKTILWNGPMGVFETPAFSWGTLAMAHAVADSGSLSVVGGGDSVAAINVAWVTGRITHISTGGGASLELLSGLELPGVKALETD